MMMMEYLHRTIPSVLTLPGDLENSLFYLPPSQKNSVHLRMAITSWTQISLDSINMKPGFKRKKKKNTQSTVSHDLCKLLVIYFTKWFWLDAHWMSLLHHYPQEALVWWCAQKCPVLSNTLEYIILFITRNYFRIRNEISLQVHYLLLKTHPLQKEYDSKVYAGRKHFC